MDSTYAAGVNCGCVGEDDGDENRSIFQVHDSPLLNTSSSILRFDTKSPVHYIQEFNQHHNHCQSSSSHVSSRTSSREKNFFLLLQLFKEICSEEEGEHRSNKTPQRLSTTQMILEFISLHPSELWLAIIYTLCIHPRSLIPHNSEVTRISTSKIITSNTNSSSSRTLNHQIQQQQFEELIVSLEQNYQSSFFPTIDQAVSLILRLISIATCSNVAGPRITSSCHTIKHQYDPNIDAIRMIIQRFQGSALYDGSVLSRTKRDEKDSLITTTTSSPHNEEDTSKMHMLELELPTLIKEAERYTGSSALDLACQYSDNPAFIVVMIDASLTSILSTNVKSQSLLTPYNESSLSLVDTSHDTQLSLLNSHHPSWLCALLSCVTDNDYNEYDGADLAASAPNSIMIKILSSISRSLIYRKDTDICARAFNYQNEGINYIIRNGGNRKSGNHQTPFHDNNGRRNQEQDNNVVASISKNYSSMIMLDLLEKAATSGHTETLVALLTINPHLILQRNADTHHMLLQTTVFNFRYESNQEVLVHYLPEREWSRRIEFILQEGMKYQIIDNNLSSYLVGGLFAVDSHIDGILEEMTHLLGKENCWQMITTCLNQYSYEDAPILHAAIGKVYQDTIKIILKHFKTSAFLRDRSRDLAIHAAIKRGMKWNNGLCDILAANRLAATAIEITSGLPSCVLAAVGRDEGTPHHNSTKVELKSVYELFRVALRKRDFDIRQIIVR